MTDITLLAKARKARFDDLPNFSGHPSEDVERFLKSIKNITKANDESDNPQILEIVRGKLTSSAGIWFDNNEHNFRRWSDFENAFRNRYFSTTIIHKKFDKLKQRTQTYNEPITSYFDDVINLCREIDPKMSDQIIIQYLMSGLHPDLKKELSRRESSLNTLSEFLKYAKIEQDLYDTFERTRQLSINPEQPKFDYNQVINPAITAIIKRQDQRYKHINQNDYKSHDITKQSSAIPRNSIYQSESRPAIRNNQQTYDKFQQRPTNNFYNDRQMDTRPSFTNCKICGRRNHRTIDCFHKRTTGCFNCGQNHVVRDCNMPPNFQ